jgi:hypothetical protein
VGVKKGKKKEKKIKKSEKGIDTDYTGVVDYIPLAA